MQETVVARLSIYDEEGGRDDEDMCFGKMVGRTLSKMTTRNEAHARLEISSALQVAKGGVRFSLFRHY